MCLIECNLSVESSGSHRRRDPCRAESTLVGAKRRELCGATAIQGSKKGFLALQITTMVCIRTRVIYNVSTKSHL